VVVMSWQVVAVGGGGVNNGAFEVDSSFFGGVSIAGS